MIQRLICTIITKSYLAHARALAESIRKHNPDLPPLLVLLADRVDGCFDPKKEPFDMIQLADLADQEAVQQMSFYYTPFEFCCALRGCLHGYILDHTDAQSWMFLDSDVLVYHDLNQVFHQIDAHSIVLSPHLTAPVDHGEFEISALHAGLYNAGFLGLRRTDVTRTFVSWFQQRLRWHCFEDHPIIFVDQAWLDLVPLFFPDVSLLKHKGANLGHWNLRGYRISQESEGFSVDNVPIQFVHFSGWDPTTPDQVSKHNPQLNANTCPGWGELGADYARRLNKLDYEAACAFPYAFSIFDDGATVSRYHRRAYYASLQAKTWKGGSPFSNRKEFISPLWLRLAKRLGRSWKALRL